MQPAQNATSCSQLVLVHETTGIRGCPGLEQLNRPQWPGPAVKQLFGRQSWSSMQVQGDDNTNTTLCCRTRHMGVRCRLRRLQAREEAAKAGAHAFEARALALRQEAAQQVAGMLASSIAPEESGTFAAASGELIG